MTPKELDRLRYDMEALSQYKGGVSDSELAGAFFRGFIEGALSEFRLIARQELIAPVAKAVKGTLSYGAYAYCGAFVAFFFLVFYAFT